MGKQLHIANHGGWKILCPRIFQIHGHIIQPDIPKAGGLLECKKIGDLASLYNIPMCGQQTRVRS